MAEPQLVIEHVTKVYERGDVLALRDVSLTVNRGEFVVLIGLSGSGKSTLLRCINRLIEPTSGRILLNGVDVTAAKGQELRSIRRRIGMVFQHFNLVKRSSVLRNVLAGRLGYAPPLPTLVGRFPREDVARARQSLETVGLVEKIYTRADQLSGGQQQRVAIARALVGGAPLILADEPTGNLDTKTSDEIMDLFENLNRTKGITIILVTHEPDVARYSRRVVTVRDGLIVSDEPMEKRTEIEKEGECA